jgi:hypothetical protein
VKNDAAAASTNPVQDQNQPIAPSTSSSSPAHETHSGAGSPADPGPAGMETQDAAPAAIAPSGVKPQETESGSSTSIAAADERGAAEPAGAVAMPPGEQGAMPVIEMLLGILGCARLHCCMMLLGATQPRHCISD